MFLFLPGAAETFKIPPTKTVEDRARASRNESKMELPMPGSVTSSVQFYRKQNRKYRSGRGQQ